VRMCVLVGDFAVCGPACVTDAKRTGDRFLPHELCERRDPTRTFARFQTAPVYNSDTS